MKILVTGATGRTGQAIVKRFAQSRKEVIIFNRSKSSLFKNLKNVIQINGDLKNISSFEQAIKQTDVIYHIPPNMNVDEIVIGKKVIELAKKYNLSHLVYHSVLFPNLQNMPHHWNKLFVEEAIIESGLPYTILQPSSYMNNILNDRVNIIEKNTHKVTFSINSKVNIVSLDDVAEVADKIIGNNSHFYTTYQLAGPEMLSAIDKAEILSSVLNRKITALEESISDFETGAINNKIDENIIKTRIKMFSHYNRMGLHANPNVHSWILNRSPTNFENFVKKYKNMFEK
tara:strand:+ start:1205 stop:2065 length:861 start_codon:yes stop_codon:yes gene_type:complete